MTLLDDLINVCAVSILVLLSSHATSGFSAKLRHVSTVYLPHSYGGGSSEAPQYGFDTDAVENAVFEPTGKIIYAVGQNALHAINASDPHHLNVLTFVSYVHQKATDVALCSGAVFVSYTNRNNPLQGGLFQYRLYDTQRGTMTFVRPIPIGSKPEKMLPTKNCTLVVALENPPVVLNDQVQDPPGGVGIIRFPNGVANDPTTQTLDFTAFDNRFEELSRKGVRWVYRENNRFSDDIEPEFVTFNADQTKAYISLQENNAIAVVDLRTGTITDLYGLGHKSWALSRLDPSDKDGGVRMAPWAVRGMYQPEGMQWFQWRGQGYVITANEGSRKKFRHFQEAQRGRSFLRSQLSASISPQIRTALETDAQLGRLKLSTVDGKNQAGKFETLYTYGARSFSIWRASDMVQVFDSGSELGEKTAELRPELFNNCIKDGDSTVASGMDKCSDDRGVEAESVAVGRVEEDAGERLMLFVGMDNPGSIAVYSLGPDDTPELRPRFESLYTGGVPAGGNSSSWNQMYEDRRLHALGIESISYLAEDSGLAGCPMLLVAGGTSGTVTLLQVLTSDATTTVPVLSILLSCLLSLGLLLPPV
ncbi:uncharacterized protein LOC143300238 [Babylonia areolata]|uniref:uncharacterized protein LOC143300238 n=1 Tax=Babylonia areolata TaxID=304850 RepID=UPI003FCF31BC